MITNKHDTRKRVLIDRRDVDKYTTRLTNHDLDHLRPDVTL